MTDTLPIVEQLAGACGDAQRARLLLRLPHATLVEAAAELHAACARCGFAAGARFVEVRVAYAAARLDPMGRNPLQDTWNDCTEALAAWAASRGA